MKRAFGKNVEDFVKLAVPPFVALFVTPGRVDVLAPILRAFLVVSFCHLCGRLLVIPCNILTIRPI